MSSKRHVKRKHEVKHMVCLMIISESIHPELSYEKGPQCEQISTFRAF